MSGTTALSHHAAVELAVTRFFQMLNSHCPGNLAPLMTNDVELFADEVGVGQEAVNAFFMRLWEAYPCISFVVKNVITNEIGAAAEVTYENGPKGAGDRCFVFQFKNDKIRRVRCY